MRFTKRMDMEVIVSGMVTLPNGDSVLADGQDVPLSPTFWDIEVLIYPNGYDEHETLIEIEDISDRRTVNIFLGQIQTLFPNIALQEN
jgi:hypothetical protein